MLQQRQCRDKLRALRQVRDRMRFYASPATDKRRKADSFAMHIDTSMIFSGEEQTADWQEEEMESSQDVGIEALGSLEMLLFGFFSKQELLNVSAVCRAWRTLARDDLFWEPLLVTPLERYPLRPLLGLERDITGKRRHMPAILVYMVFQKLRLAQAPPTADCSSDTATNAANPRYSERVLQYLRTLGAQAPNRMGGRLLPRLMRRGAGGQGGAALSSVHLVCLQNPTVSLGLRQLEEEQVTQLEQMHLQPEREQQEANGRDAGVVPGDALNRPVVNEQQGAGVADDEDVYSIVDGRHRVTLSSWISTKERVSERTLRSFFRQMLLAVHSMEQASCEHVDISPVNIVVHCPQAEEENSSSAVVPQPQAEESGSESLDDGDVEMSAPEMEQRKIREDCRGEIPLFQLFLCRRNYQQVGAARAAQRMQDPAIALEGEAEVPALIGMDVGGARANFRQRLAEARAGGDVPVLGNHPGLPHQNMVSSVIQCAVTVWARGRFTDTNASSLLTLLLRFPNSFPSGLRAFLEYAKFLIISHSASAAKLLRHEYLQSRVPTSFSPHWCTTTLHDINEYKSKLVAHYGALPSRLEPLDDDLGISAALMDELMPRTELGYQYFSEALKEGNLSSERFVSVVAPSTVSSSWVRTLARTQVHTLQRLDLSQARVPTSVLLHELEMLPRVTHLRLPRQILRDENLEHLVAALAYSGLLPRLACLDENVRQAMDRMEKSYLMQLDMFSFLLQKPSPSAPAGGC